MAKKPSAKAVREALAEDVSPEEQLAALDAAPEAPTIREKEEAAAGVTDQRIADRRPEALPTFDHSSVSASEALGKPASGTVRCVIADYDRFHTAGAVGDGAILYGCQFIKDLNGDMVGDVPEDVVDAMVSGGQVVLESKHSPKDPASADEVSRAQNRGRVLAV